MSLTIRNVRLAYPASHPYSRQTFNVQCEGRRVVDIKENDSSTGSEQAPPVSFDSKEVDGGGGLLLPSLCHSHIHLDTCYSHEDASAPIESIYDRATRLIRESVQAGVTTMRAHVEVDESVGTSHIEVALKLKNEWKGRCDIRLCVFMQQPLYASSGTADGTEPKLNANATALQNTLHQHSGEVSALGSAPFLDNSPSDNMRFIFGLANRHKLHVDFHLDYNLAEGEDLSEDEKRAGVDAMIWDVLEMVRGGFMGDEAVTNNGEERTLAIGHGIRLTLFSHEALQRLRSEILSLRKHTRVYLVALPPCDVHTKGRDLGGAFDKCRATLNVVKLTQEYGSEGSVEEGNYEKALEIALAVGNVQNDFAPQGNADLLELCPVGVMLYQVGLRFPLREGDGQTGREDDDHTRREDEVRILLESITLTSRLATGIPPQHAPSPNMPPTLSLVPRVGDPADFVILHGNKSLWGAALSPSYERTTVYQGRVVGWRRASVAVRSEDE